MWFCVCEVDTAELMVADVKLQRGEGGEWREGWREGGMEGWRDGGDVFGN